MITPPETMFIIFGVLFVSLSFVTWTAYVLSREIKYLQDFVKSGESEQ